MFARHLDKSHTCGSQASVRERRVTYTSHTPVHQTNTHICFDGRKNEERGFVQTMRGNIQMHLDTLLEATDTLSEVIVCERQSGEAGGVKHTSNVLCNFFLSPCVCENTHQVHMSAPNRS